MNKVRIIGGKWRRRLLSFPDQQGLRPTPDRVRETLFNWLGQDLRGRSCLDLFAGSGALGFEAASRGAAEVVMVESAASVCAALHANAQLLQGPAGLINAEQRLEIVRADAVKFASSLCTGAAQRRFDVLFLDPPYQKGLIETISPFFEGLLKRDALIYVEAERALDQLGDWQVFRQGRAGQAFYHLMHKENEST